MPLIIPPAVNYPSPLTAVPSLMQDEPTEGRKQVAVEILWASMGGPSKCVAINLQNNATLNVSQISSLKVDNSLCAVDVTFIWPDTGDTTTIPARTPFALVPVFSNAVQVFVSAPNALAVDVTRFQLLNYHTDPADIPQTVETQPATSGGTVLGNGNVTMQLIPATVNGTLETLVLSINAQAATAGPQQLVVTVLDGTGVVGLLPGVLINQMNFGIPTGFADPNKLLLNLTDLNWRFTQGLKIFVAPVTAQTVIGNAFANYRIP